MTKEYCGTYWGSHGCDLPRGHAGEHLCGFGDPDGVCSTPTRWHDGLGGTDGGDLADWTPWPQPFEIYH